MSVPYGLTSAGSPGGSVTRTLPRMAKLGWIGSVALAAGASAGAAAAQFGLGYGLGIISWSPVLANGPQTTDSVWLSSLAWTTWIAATSTVVGAICADRRSAGEIGAAPPRPAPDRFGVTPPSGFASAIWRVLLAVSAAVGALLSVALVLVPARAAIRSDTTTPQLIAAGYAVVGIVVGILIAVTALVSRAGAANVIASAAWLWMLAVATVIDGVAVGRGLGTAPLGVWPFHSRSSWQAIWSLPSAWLMLGVAFVIGAGAAWGVARRGEARIGTYFSGALGPLVVAVAYSLTVPGLVGVNDAQVSAFQLAPYAVITGLAGSAFIVAVRSLRASALDSAIDLTDSDLGGQAIGRAKPPVSRPVPAQTAKPGPSVKPGPSAKPALDDEVTQPLPGPALVKQSDGGTEEVVLTKATPSGKRGRRS
jgi:hypothetical protein